jgi:hypothetical protein
METEYGQKPLVALVPLLLLLLIPLVQLQTKPSRSSKVHILPIHTEMESSVKGPLEISLHM